MTDAQIPKRWLPFTRALWFMLVLLSLAIYVAGISPNFNELRVVCTAAECHAMALTPQEVQELRGLGLSLELYAGYQVTLDIYAFVTLIPVAALIFWRKSDTWLGSLLSLLLVYFGTITALSTSALVRLYPNLNWPIFFLDNIASIFIVMLFFLFPDGRFVPRWTRFIVIAFLGGFLIDMLLLTSGPLTPSYGALSEALWLVTLLVGVLAQVYRYRRVSTLIQRQQTKWTMFGLMVVFIGSLVWTLFVELSPPQPGSTRLAFKLGFGIAVLLYTIFPLSLVFSILRYRLWDIDILINRTLVYGLLTGMIALMYFGSVVLLQALFTAVSGQRSAVAIVISTLIIAALFNPLRLRVQSLIDRRFFRRKYDAEQTLAAFAEAARDEVDLERLTAEMMRVVQETMQPEHAWLFLRRTGDFGGSTVIRDGRARYD